MDINNVVLHAGQTLHVRAGDYKFDITRKKNGVSLCTFDESDRMTLISEEWFGQEGDPLSLIEAHTTTVQPHTDVKIARD